jgi:HupE / UreJ protein
MRRLLLLCLASPLWAHVVSISTGELRVDGPTAVFELRIPIYEIAHVANPETALIDHVRFAGARLASERCRAEQDDYVCVANYEFPARVDRINVECTLFAVTVPNHVHILHAIEGPNSDDAVFDETLTRAEIRFHPPSRLETATRDAAFGVKRAAAGISALFLLILMIAARSAREAVLLAAMYLAGEWLMRPIAPLIPWQFSPRFLDAVMALTVAYLALEILVLPRAGSRWAVVLALGFFHGFYFAAFPPAYLAGAAIAQAAILVALVWIALRFATPALRRASAALLLAAGLGLFAAQLIR